MRAVYAGPSKRVRPVTMTATSTIAGLLPVMLSSGTGSDVMQRVAAPMVGGMFNADPLSSGAPRSLRLGTAIERENFQPQPAGSGEREHSAMLIEASHDPVPSVAVMVYMGGIKQKPLTCAQRTGFRVIKRGLFLNPGP